MSEWQPIETAPKDGTAILACNSRLGHEPVAVRWMKDWLDEEPCWHDSATASGDALHYNGNFFDYWMPLPKPPAQSGQGANRHSQDDVGGTELRPLTGMAGGDGIEASASCGAVPCAADSAPHERGER